MTYNFKIAKDMAMTLASRFGVGYVNYSEGGGYYATTCMTARTIGSMSKAGKFSVCQKQRY